MTTFEHTQALALNCYITSALAIANIISIQNTESMKVYLNVSRTEVMSGNMIFVVFSIKYFY